MKVSAFNTALKRRQRIRCLLITSLALLNVMGMANAQTALSRKAGMASGKITGISNLILNAGANTSGNQNIADRSGFNLTHPAQSEWDTIFSFDNENFKNRYTQLIENSGLDRMQVKQIWQTGSWVNSLRVTYSYDPAGNLLTYLPEQWINEAWMESSRILYSYDDHGNAITEINENWESNDWKNAQRYSATYDPNGNPLIILEDKWENNSWVNSERYTFTYDLSGNEISLMEESWENGAWVNSWRSSKTYDDAGHEISETDENWNSNAWLTLNRLSYTYDAGGSLTTKFSEDWVDDHWLYRTRRTYTYDSFGNMTAETDEEWEGGTWNFRIEHDRTFDPQGNMVSETEFKWEDAAWKYVYRKFYQYDDLGNSVSGRQEDWTYEGWKPALGSLLVFSSGNPIYLVIGSRYETNFSSGGSGIPDIPGGEQSIVRVFPNPAKESITVETNGSTEGKRDLISIYTTQGQLVAQQESAGKQSIIDISRFTQGIYILKLTGKSGSHLSRFVVD